MREEKPEIAKHIGGILTTILDCDPRLPAWCACFCFSPKVMSLSTIFIFLFRISLLLSECFVDWIVDVVFRVGFEDGADCREQS